MELAKGYVSMLEFSVNTLYIVRFTELETTEVMTEEVMNSKQENVNGPKKYKTKNTNARCKTTG